MPYDRLSATQDDILAELVRTNIGARQYFVAQLQTSVTKFFNDIYPRGDSAVMALHTVVLERSLWKAEEARSHCESELFQLFLAKLMECGYDLGARALKGVVRLLMVDAENLQHLVDEEELDSIIAAFDVRLSDVLRNQATLATTKYLEASKEAGQQLFEKIITKRVSRGRNNDFIIAFSAGACVFPICPEVASSLFLAEGFIPTLIPRFERKHPSQSAKRAVLELLNAACMEKSCREAIQKYCTEWLENILEDESRELADVAAVVLAKIQASQTNGAADGTSRVTDEGASLDELVERFKSLIVNKPSQDKLKNTIEGLAYSSVKPAIKEQLCKTAVFPSELVKALKGSIPETTLLFGGLITIYNLVKYRPLLTEEQKKISQLKDYANTKRPSPEDVLDDDEHVIARCSVMVDAGIVPLLVDCSKNPITPSVRNTIAGILLSLSRNPKTRGRLAQQGAVKLLISLTNTDAAAGAEPERLDETALTAAHALARILISVNPSLVFPASGFPQITSAIRPLVALLSPPDEGPLSDAPRNLLPIFESLLALTNLASSPDQSAASTIVRFSWPTESSSAPSATSPVIDSLFLSSNPLITRAATELTCNLTTCPAGVALFVPAVTPRASQRMHVVLALADAEDLPTRSAAAGALAILAPVPAAADNILAHARAPEIVTALCEDEVSALVFRGLACVADLCDVPGETGARARAAFKGVGAFERIKGRLEQCRMPDDLQAVQLGVEALKRLQ